MKIKHYKNIVTIISAFIIILAYGVNKVEATLISSDSTFGIDTITLDTDTGFQWLDVPLSTAYSYDSILVELQSGGTFEGYRLATRDEVLTLWDNSGIDTSLSGFVSENFQPIVDLMSFVGVNAHNGNLGGGNLFDFTAGNIDNGIVNSGDWITLAVISADPDPTLTGRASFGTVPSNNENNSHGSWLIASVSVPEPSMIALMSAGLIGLGFARRRARK